MHAVSEKKPASATTRLSRPHIGNVIMLSHRGKSYSWSPADKL